MGALDGKVAFITGAGSGIGQGTAERLARDGADICIAEIDMEGAEHTASRVREFGREAQIVKVNVASQAQVQAGVAECVQRFGRLDIAVANAGIGRGASILDLTLKDWQDQVDVNFTGVFLTVQAAAREMVRLGNGGRIVCISSLAAENTGPGIWSYSATKAGVRIMVRGWGQELGQYGITVNAIGPGVIDTPLAHGLAGDEGGPIRTALEERTPVGRAGRPADIAGLIAFMAGPDGAFMTGSYVLIDGGLRDSRGAMPDPESPAMKERMRIAEGAAARNQMLNRLIDER